MALPIAGAVILGGAKAIATGVGGIFTRPLGAVQSQLGNYALPISLPAIDGIIAAHQRGLIGGLAAYQAAARLGVMFDPEQQAEARVPPLNFERRIWDAAAELQWIRPFPAFWLDALARGMIPEETAAENLREGGAKLSHWRELLPTFWAVPPPGALSDALNRGIIGPGEFDELLKRLGYGEARYREIIDELREAIPSISDLVHMQVREVFSIPLAQELGLYDEFPADIVPHMERLGYFGGPGDMVLSDGEERPLLWPLAYWAAHWQPISPTQNYEMMYRLRPGRMQIYADRLQSLTGQPAQLVPWNMDQVRRWLRVQDYPPGIRDNLAAISFRLPRLIDLRNAFRLRVLTAEQLKEHLLDRGHPPDDADWLTDLFRRQEAARLNQPQEALQRSLTRRTYEAIRCLYRARFINQGEARGRLTITGVTAEVAELFTETVDLERECEKVQTLLRRLRREFLAGDITAADVRVALDAAGWQSDAIDAILEEWGPRLTRRRRQMSTATIQRLHRDGFIDNDEAQRRLRNLGWSTVDAQVFVSESIARMLRSQAIFAYRELQQRVREVRQLARGVEQTARRQAQERLAAARRLEAVQRRSENLARRTQADLRRVAPVARLVRWFARGHIDIDFFTDQLRAQGYPPQAVTNYLREAEDAKREYQARAAGNGQAEPESTAESGSA